MISTNALSVFILRHHLNGLGNKNTRSIQEIICASEPSTKKYKKGCEDFPNLAILTKSARGLLRRCGGELPRLVEVSFFRLRQKRCPY